MKATWFTAMAVVILTSSLASPLLADCSSPGWQCRTISSQGIWSSTYTAQSKCRERLETDALAACTDNDPFDCPYGFEISPYIYTAVSYSNLRCNLWDQKCLQWIADCSAGVAAKCARPAWQPVDPLVAGNGGSSPIVFNLGRGNFTFTSAADGVAFDFEGTGSTIRTGWTNAAQGDAFLALDRDANGRIDNGLELFGDSTPQQPSAAPNGYIALAHYDTAEGGGNGDGAITPADFIWTSLWLWTDRNQNGYSEVEEIQFLSSTDIHYIDLSYVESRRRDRYGNELRYTSTAFRTNGAPIQTTDVFFTTK